MARVDRRSCWALTRRRTADRDPLGTLDVVGSVRVGQIIAGRYVIERQVGKGGFGEVFAARHNGTGQLVALKCLNTSGVEDITLKRFFLEARVTSALRHPNTIRVFDFGQDASGLLYIAMELLSGRTLKEELRARKKAKRVFTEAEAVQVGVGILRSLIEAHAEGLVHRDLKPDNVFLQEVPGEEPIIKVLDFGIVKLGDSTITIGSDSGVPGTPAYMSPEQVTRMQIDGRSDLYSLGCVLYQLVSGSVPLRGDSAMQTLYLHVHERVPNLRHRARAAISDRFAAVVHRALEKDAADRFQDAKAMKVALEKCLSSPRASALLDLEATRLMKPAQPAMFAEMDEHDPSVPDLSKQQLMRPKAQGPGWLWLFAALFTGMLAFTATALFLMEEPQAQPVPVRVPVPKLDPVPVPMIEPVVEEPPPIPETPAPKPRPKRAKRSAPEPKDEILDQKI
jgi:serine/threonine protein kinase